jgi:hypothetical protein
VQNNQTCHYIAKRALELGMNQGTDEGAMQQRDQSVIQITLDVTQQEQDWKVLQGKYRR